MKDARRDLTPMSQETTHVCPICKRTKPAKAVCEYCSEQMIPVASVAGRRILTNDPPRGGKENSK